MLGYPRDILSLPRVVIYVILGCGGINLCLTIGILDRSTGIHGRFVPPGLLLTFRVFSSR